MAGQLQEQLEAQEQQLEVLQEQQLEQLHDELLAPSVTSGMSTDGSTMSITSKTAASRASSSVLRAVLISPHFPGQPSDRHVGAGQLVLVLEEQQLEVLQEQQLEQLHDELQDPSVTSGMSTDGSTVSITSKVAASRASSSVLRVISSFLVSVFRPWETAMSVNPERWRRAHDVSSSSGAMTLTSFPGISPCSSCWMCSSTNMSSSSRCCTMSC